MSCSVHEAPLLIRPEVGQTFGLADVPFELAPVVVEQVVDGTPVGAVGMNVQGGPVLRSTRPDVVYQISTAIPGYPYRWCG